MMPKGVFPHCERCGSRVQQWTVRVCARCRLNDETKEGRQ
ncbi:hypothetical protein PP506_gp61 [Gordonia phage DobbysSock]|uniref:Uncharacterized protein n=1 Tax=Gordonia phage DobbysSock TaxID=2652880 RepID=A0A5P8DCM1_9CAUD|nr:hypothetical protein PP506_gp61 [Gordonia phage DobbysSock]QFP96182.1 hypothetical protein DOBBYSSOCK_SEA_61 [Gordonia phage DobbysSock]